MKANQKFQKQDEAVSPVIAVILMVAITVVLAATVYVWVSGFGASGSQSKTMSLSVASTSGGVASITVVSVSPNTNWNNIKVIADIASGTKGILVTGAGFSAFNNGDWDGGSQLSATSRVAAAGDTIKLGVSALPASALTLKVVDKSANTVVTQISVPSLTAQTLAADEIATCPASTAATFASNYYSKTGTDTAALQLADLSRTGNALTDVTHSSGATSATLAPASSSAEVLSFAANKAWDIAGNVVADSCTVP